MEGLTVQENSVIESKAGVELYVEATVGVIATIKANSKVKVEAPVAALNLDAVLDLQQGNVISQVDPKAKAKYGVRTPCVGTGFLDTRQSLIRRLKG